LILTLSFSWIIDLIILRISKNKKLSNDFADLQVILDSKNKELDLLRHDIANLVEDNNFILQEKNRLEIAVKFFLDSYFFLSFTSKKTQI